MSLPLWIYIGWGVFSRLQNTYRSYRSVREGCIVKNGVNRLDVGGYTKEIECKNGVFNGFTRIYNSKGILTYEGVYLNGKLNGTENVYYDDGKIKILTNYENGVKDGIEVFYNKDGSTSLYIINNKGKSNQVYFQIPEDDLDREISLESQEFLCKNREEYLSKNYSYSCLGDAVNGEFIKYDLRGNLLLKARFTNGVLDGIYEKFSNGKPYIHLEFRNGKLEGRSLKYFTDGSIEYEGQYVNGVQEGIFRRYNYKGSVESEVVFENGIITKINIQ